MINDKVLPKKYLLMNIVSMIYMYMYKSSKTFKVRNPF